MELPRLLPLLASLQMIPRPVSPADPLPAPQLTVSTLHLVYLPGEAVTLTCSAARVPVVSGIRFFRDDQEIHSRKLAPWHSYIHSIQLPGDPGSQAGSYSCESWKTEAGREIPSERSRTIRIAVTDPLPTPQLSMFPPQPVYLTGEAVTLTCSAAGSPTVSGIRFYRDSQEIQSEELPSSRGSHTESLPLSSVSAGSAGEYSCESWKTVSGREIKSARSRLISIRVTDPLPSPQLTVSPLQPVYITGEAVTLTCSAAGASTVSGFRFFRDSQEIQSKELPLSHGNHTESLPLSSVSAGSAGQYSCESWKTVSGREIKSARSRSSSIRVTARPPPPSLSLDPPQPIYIQEEWVTLRCSGQLNEKAAGYRFFNQSGEQISSGESSQGTWQISASNAAANQAYTCQYWRVEHGREIPSEKSPSVPVSVKDPPPQPELSVDPPSRAVSEEFSLNITCTAPGDAHERRFHFYKDGVELNPGDLGSEISTMQPGTGSVKVSVLSVPWTSPNITGELTCGYEENLAGKWVPSSKSRAVKITVSGSASHGFRWVRELAVGGSFFLINGLIFLISHCYF